MYYIICTIVIMVFCITALTNKNAYEGEFLSQGPRSPRPQPQKCVTERHIECNNNFGVEASLLQTSNLKQDTYKTATLPHSPNQYRIHTAIKLNCGLVILNEVDHHPFEILSAKKEAIRHQDNRSLTTVQANYNPHLKPASSAVFLLTLIVPVTPFFLTNCKNETTRRINTSANECHSLRQLRYNIAQIPINNGATYRKVLKLKFDQEKSRTFKNTSTKYLAGRLFIYSIRFS